MRLQAKHAGFAAFVALFATLAAYVFWGTWSTWVAPVMPDCATTHPLSYATRVSRWFNGWLGSGRFLPSDLATFLVSPYVWQELQYVAGAFFAALGLVYYLRGRGVSRVARYGAGLFLAFSGYWFTLFSAGHVSWFVWMTYGVFAFGLCDRVARVGRMRHWVMLGATVAWASFWQVDLWLLFTAFTAVYFVRCFVRERRLPDWRGLLVAAAVFFAIGTPAFRDALVNALGGRDRQIEESKGTALAGGKGVAAATAGEAERKRADDEARWVFVTNWSLPPDETLEFFVPRLNGDTSCPMTLAFGRRAGRDVTPYTGRLGRPLGAKAGNYRQHSLYVGRVTCLLALAALVFAFWRPRTGEAADAAGRDGDWLAANRGEILFFAIAAFVFWLFAMGRYCEPVYRLVYRLPFGDYLRGPVKWHHLTEFCLALLAGYGLEALRRIAKGMCKAKGAKCAWVPWAVGALVVFGAVDEARIDRLYCAPMDLTLALTKNPAAEEIERRGGGLVADLVQQGQGPLAWGFTVREIGVTRDPLDKKVRFLWGTSEQFADKRFAGWLKAKGATPAGCYAVTADAIRAVDPPRANVMLYEIPGVPKKGAPGPRPTPSAFTMVFGLLSVFATFGAAAYGAVKS